MRKALNENPLVAIGVVAVLGIVMVLMLMSSLSKSSGGSSAPSTTTTAATTVPGSATAPSTGTATPAAPAGTASSPAPAPAGGLAAFVPGPGLPKPVVKAYRAGDIVVLLVLKRNGIDDRSVKAAIHSIQNVPKVALFETYAKRVARYSRIAEGVDLNRVPALVVIDPRRNSKSVPTATVSYGVRSSDNIAQAIRDAAYKGPNHLPFSPR
jgi:hypothetical protein